MLQLNLITHNGSYKISVCKHADDFPIGKPVIEISKYFSKAQNEN